MLSSSNQSMKHTEQQFTSIKQLKLKINNDKQKIVKQKKTTQKISNSENIYIFFLKFILSNFDEVVIVVVLNPLWRRFVFPIKHLSNMKCNSLLSSGSLFSHDTDT